MKRTSLQRAAALAALLAAGTATGASAQEAPVDPHHAQAGAAPSPAEAAGAPPTALPEDMAGQEQGAQAGQPGTTSPATTGGMMGEGGMSPRMMDGMAPDMMGEMAGGMMDPAMMAGMMPSGMTEGMPGMAMGQHMMKVMFAIVDADGDGGLSREEIAEVQRRVFAAADADEDGSVTPEELRGFLRE